MNMTRIAEPQIHEVSGPIGSNDVLVPITTNRINGSNQQKEHPLGAAGVCQYITNILENSANGN